MSHKKIFLNIPLALLLLGTLAACDQNRRNVAVIDAEQIYQKSKVAAEGMKHLETLTGQVQNALMQMQEQLKAAPEDKELEQRLQTEIFALQGNLDKAQREVAERVNKRFDDAVEAYRKQQNLELVLPRQLVMAVRPEADITQKIIELMDAESADFSDIVLVKEATDSGSPAAEDQNSAPADGQPADAAK
ncbi:MAG: OmpH family outer membrane protein [Deltaproteobacteria bacterium]|jgi:Skp family chaperone for outer membrane proteins|nr:OmpH family outer membrane protein [Deltaproteobacteria bacterium]